jgi:hypothetical protein
MLVSYCCCRNVYSESLGQIEEAKICDPTYYRGLATDTVTHTNRWAFDHKNETLYVGRVGGLYRLSADLATATLISGSFNLTSSSIAVDYTNSRIFYTRNSSTVTCEIRRINYDGSGDTAILSFTNTDPNASGANYRRVVYDRVNDTIYYHLQKTYSGVGAPPETYEMYRANADGSAEILIASHGSVADRQVVVDKTNSKLWWININGSAHYEIRRSELDGTSPSVVYDTGSSSNQVTSMQWSHKLQRLWYWETKATPNASTSGLYSNNYAWTDLVHELNGNATHVGVGSSIMPTTQLFLACGIETTGASTAA